MEIQQEGYHYTLPLWAETPARVRRRSSENVAAEAGPFRSYAEARAREVQSSGRDEGLNFKHLSRGEETADTCTLKEVQLGQKISVVGPVSLSPIIKIANSLTTKIKNPSLEKIDPTIMFKSASFLEPMTKLFDPMQLKVSSSPFSFSFSGS